MPPSCLDRSLRMGALMSPALIEPLEFRWLFAVNLFASGFQAARPIYDDTLLPGQGNVLVNYEVGAIGDVTGSISVAFRLVPLHPILYNPGHNFDAPGAIPLG